MAVDIWKANDEVHAKVKELIDKGAAGLASRTEKLAAKRGRALELKLSPRPPTPRGSG